VRVLFFSLIVIVIGTACAADTAEKDAVMADAVKPEAVKPDAVEAAASCVVIHEKSDADGVNNITCFENIALERSSFESGVCQWQTDSQASTDVKTVTQFVERCPVSYRASCDRLVLAPNITAPVKIFLYDRSDEILMRAQKQCLSGNGEWTNYEKESS
jgi:hypothetical protein